MSVTPCSALGVENTKSSTIGLTAGALTSVKLSPSSISFNSPAPKRGWVIVTTCPFST